MSVRVRDQLTAQFGELRYEPIEQRIRAVIGNDTVVDTTRARVVWEPRRVVPSYAAPEDDIRGELVASTVPRPNGSATVGSLMPELSSRPILDPSVPFAVHTANGEAVELHGRAAFRLADAELAGYVVLDFDGFDAWYEEDEPVVSHARAPFHHIDVLPSSRVVRVELDGHVLAESQRARFLFESFLPTRFYLPRADVRVPLQPSARRTVCAYKGQASYWSVEVDGQVIPDLAWSYEDPRHDADRVKGLVAFFDERVDVLLDGVRRPRPLTPWSPR